jgi:hypothetical protein
MYWSTDHITPFSKTETTAYIIIIIIIINY